MKKITEIFDFSVFMNCKKLVILIFIISSVLSIPFYSFAGDFESLKAAIELRDIDKVRSVLVYGADANARNSKGDVALFYAALGGHVEIVRLLLDRGADVNAKNNEGWTALMTATTSGNAMMVKFLLDNGADPAVEANLKDAGKRTALSIAKIKKNKDIIELLEKYSSKNKNVSAKSDNSNIPDYEYMRALRTVNGILNAWIKRDQNIKEFFSRKMLIDKVNDDFVAGFIGVSNPHNQSFEISGGKKINDREYEFDVVLYYLYSNDPESCSGVPGKIRAVREENSWLIDKWVF
ncbi:MAG TPA: ankyrin repeat domain-containing protein [Candidatus Wallbacteria bacterium]|nr:MAG: Ankyrin repeats (3 copies) [bacterium ADurb.Bin243]HOD39805.1 ankyrin repeat domain-containing protein [Candidatus Wallbacteria bacterium]HPG57966.1 ankyrin repeat domain-containing protein [Candidatus Wallbacteria bacterium]